MKTTEFTIYKDTTGTLRLDNFTTTYPNNDWGQFLKDTNQAERLERLCSMSSRKRSPRIWKIRKSAAFIEWQKGKYITVTSKPYGTAGADYDGRIPELAIKRAILEAIKYGEKEARYYPSSNATKPAYERTVYVFGFWFKKAEGGAET